MAAERFYEHTSVRRCLDEFAMFRMVEDRLPTVQDRIKALFESALAHEGSKVEAHLGIFVGATNGKHVRFHVHNNSLFHFEDEAHSSGQVVFKKLMKGDLGTNLIAHVLSVVQGGNAAPRAEAPRFTFNTKDYLVLKRFYSNDVVEDLDPATKQVLRVNKVSELDSAIVYRPNTCLQLKFSLMHHQPLSQVADATLVREESLKVIEFHFDEDVLKWRVVVALSQNDPMLDDENAGSEEARVHITLDNLSWHLLRTIDQADAPPVPSGIVLGNVAKLFYHNVCLLSDVEDTTYNDEGLYYPNIVGDNAADVKRHYNLKKIALAGDSSIEIVRLMNNQCKRFLIDEWVAGGATILDLACGHGQDLLKYLDKTPKTYVGIDFSAQEIKEAKRRVSRQRDFSFQQSDTEYRFHVGNMLMTESYEKFLFDKKFDVLSVQLAIHYTLSTEKHAHYVLKSIADRLKPGGIFIGTCPSSFVIAERMKSEQFHRDNQGCLFGNPVYSVTFPLDSMNMYHQQPSYADGFNVVSGEVVLPGDSGTEPWISQHQQNNPDRLLTALGSNDDSGLHTRIESDATYYELNEMWGVPYHFWLVDHIDATEYVVPWRAFCRLAKSLDLVCMFMMPFDHFLKHMINKGHPDALRFNDQLEQKKHKAATSEYQLEVVSFYHVFAFQKRAPTGARLDPNEIALQPPALSRVNQSQMMSAR